MRVAIVHYHLHPGGVTRVIRHTVSALQEREARVAVIIGEPAGAEGEGLSPLCVLAGLGYDGHREPWPAQELAGMLQREAEAALGGPPDIWHFHNHSLGKNQVLPGAVQHLVQAGHRLLLQIHDFPEDGRPTNYRHLLEQVGQGDTERLAAVLYPQAGQVHYAVLNGRDRGFLQDAGVPGERLHLLPNAIWVGPDGEASTERPPPTGQRLWLYPTRAIRRKNLGEFLLLAALGRDGDRFATTLAPRNPLERAGYERWVALGHNLGLPVAFAIGERPGVDFPTLVRSAHALVTTSVAEGFGLAFLEPWLMGRPVAGRNLPEITREFQDAGVDLGGLYDRLEVPLDWVSETELHGKIRGGLDSYLHAYGLEPGREDLERVLSAWVKDARLDVGRLDEDLQAQILRQVVASSAARAQLRPSAPTRIPSPEGVEHNRQAVRGAYSLEEYTRRLEDVYRRVLGSRVEKSPGAISGRSLLERFLAPERLFLLRT